MSKLDQILNQAEDLANKGYNKAREAIDSPEGQRAIQKAENLASKGMEKAKEIADEGINKAKEAIDSPEGQKVIHEAKGLANQGISKVKELAESDKAKEIGQDAKNLVNKVKDQLK